MDTMRGILDNYVEMRDNEELDMHKHDIVVFLVADGFGGLSKDFKRFMKEKKLFDENILKDQGFMYE